MHPLFGGFARRPVNRWLPLPSGSKGLGHREERILSVSCVTYFPLEEARACVGRLSCSSEQDWAPAVYANLSQKLFHAHVCTSAASILSELALPATRTCGDFFFFFFFEAYERLSVL